MDKVLNIKIETAFLIIIVVIAVLFIIYRFVLNPGKSRVDKIVKKFTTDNYSISFIVAERYAVWNNMRGFFYCLYYIFNLLSIFAGLMTVYYASTESGNHRETIIFFSLLSMCFTIGNVFSNPYKVAVMSQHVWRELDNCIIMTINCNKLTNEEKNIILAGKIVELEKYIETYER